MSKTLFSNANVYSPTGGFRNGSLLVRGERIDCVVTGEQRLTDEQVVGARVIDLDGAFVLPGFVDTHFHLSTLALKTLRCDLSSCRCAGDVYDALKHWASESDAPYIMGVEWDEAYWDDPAPPTRAGLDDIDAQRPVLARRICGHLGVANSFLLEKLGTHHPGLVDKDSGLVREHALWEAGGLCRPDPDRFAASFEGAIGKLHQLGITAIHDIVGPNRAQAYARGIARSKAPLRIDVLMHAPTAELPKYRKLFADLDPRFVRVAGVKCFLDGSLGGRTAALNRPYADTDGKGNLLIDDDELGRLLRASHEGGFVCAMHAIGDRAIDQALSTLRGFPEDAKRFRIEHCEIVGDEQLARLAEAPVFLSVQPNFVREWGMRSGMYEKQLGKERCENMNRFRSLADRGVEFVFGSDGMPPGPLYGLKGATAHPLAGERLTPRDALDRYTRRPNAIGAHERNAGIIEAGRLADLVVLDKNPLEADLDDTTVLRTMVGGELVYEAPGVAAA